MKLNEYGEIVAEEWLRSATIRKEIELDEYIVMPNHLHGNVIITDVRAQGLVPLQNVRKLYRCPRSLSTFISGFKSAVTKRINYKRKYYGQSVWQRNSYDHIVRNEKSLERIQKYIHTNPECWEYDSNNPGCIGVDEFDKWLTFFNNIPGTSKNIGHEV